MSGFILLCLVVVYCLIAFVFIGLGILADLMEKLWLSRTMYSIGVVMFVALATLLLAIFGGFIHV